VKQHKASKRRKGRAPDNDAGADEEPEDQVEMEMPVFEPPVLNYVDWSSEEKRDLFVQLTLPNMLEQPAEMQRMLLEHIRQHPSTIKMEGFPITKMVPTWTRQCSCRTRVLCCQCWTGLSKTRSVRSRTK